jgi:hypothetical protein
MSDKFVISLSGTVKKEITFDYFKLRAEDLLKKTVIEWADDPKQILEKKIPELKEYKFYFQGLYQFRQRMSKSLQHSCIFEQERQPDGSIKYMVIFDIENIMNELFSSELQYNQHKLDDVIMIISELTIKFKANNYIENMDFLFSNDALKLPTEMKEWNDLVLNMKSETFYLIDEDDEL